MKYIYFALVAAAMALSACGKDQPQPINVEPATCAVQTSSTYDILVHCPGGFTVIVASDVPAGTVFTCPDKEHKDK